MHFVKLGAQHLLPQGSASRSFALDDKLGQHILSQLELPESISFVIERFSLNVLDADAVLSIRHV